MQVNDGPGGGFGGFLDFKGLAIYEPDVFVTWQDTRAGAGGIYFSKAVGAAGAP